MLKITYATAPQLQQLLLILDVIHRDMLLAVIDPHHERALQWEAMLARLTELATQRNLSLHKSDVFRLLTSHQGVRLARPVQELVNYRFAFASLSEIIPFPRPLSVATLATLTQSIVEGSSATSRAVSLDKESDIRQLLSYLQVQRESPIVQAALAALAIHNLQPTGTASDLLAYLVAYAFLTKSNYMFRGLVVLEKIWNWQAPEVDRLVARTQETGVVTEWIMYAVTSMVGQMEKEKEALGGALNHLDVPASYFDLTDRQRRVLTYLEAPQMRITNRDVQKLCKISQITSSRDLTKLVALGLLASHGHGRSVSYTRL